MMTHEERALLIRVASQLMRGEVYATSHLGDLLAKVEAQHNMHLTAYKPGGGVSAAESDPPLSPDQQARNECLFFIREQLIAPTHDDPEVTARYIMGRCFGTAARLLGKEKAHV